LRTAPRPETIVIRSRAMARTLSLVLVLAVVSALSACSLIVSEVDLPACTDDRECAVLNLRTDGPLVTPCMLYQCSAIAGGNPGTCVYRARDADDDGQTAAMCPGGDDCDDMKSSVYVGAPELCDGLDNDCDLVIDDGDMTGAGPADLLEITAARDVTWGTGGSGSYTAGSTTVAFTLDGEGVVTQMRTVSATTNQGCPPDMETCVRNSGWRNLATQVILPPATCLARRTTWMTAAECSTDSECPQPVCVRPPPPDGGTFVPIGDCTAVDGGFTTRCETDSDCAWPCASERCVSPARDDVQPNLDCTLSDLATSPIGGDGAFAVGIETSGCDAGRLRAGWFEALSGKLLMFGPEARSNVWLGVDVGAFSQPPRDGGVRLDGAVPPRACSGADRASGTPGAARPAVAAVGPESASQALTVYLGDSRQRNGCGDAVAVPVEGLALLRETGSLTISSWVTGSNDGHPERFGDTNGGGAPAVTALPETGWIVGYPKATASGGTPIALHYVGKVARPVPYSGLEDGGAAWPGHRRRETEALSPNAPFFEVPAAGRADYVHVAVGALRGTTYDLGVTWMEGCSGVDTQTVWFSLVRFDPTSPSTATATAPVQISTAAALGGYPSIAYAGTGNPFVAPGWTRASGMPVAADARGGFVVAWAGVGRFAPRTSVYLVRVAESDGLPIDTAPQTVGPATGTTQAASVTLYPTPAASGAVSYGFWNRETQIVGGRLVCAPPPPAR